MDILGLPIFLIFAIFILGSLFLVFLPYSVARFILRREESTESSDLAMSILFRIGAVHALILALVFADEQSAFIQLKTLVADEAASISDVFYNLERYDKTNTVLIRSNIAKYTNTVIENEWADLSNGNLNEQAWTSWRYAFEAILDLQPENLRQEDLRKLMIGDMSSVANLREKRWGSTKTGLPIMFWVVALVGFALVSLPYYIFQPRTENFALLTTFAIYNGLVLYLILDVSHPYQGLIRVSAAPFQYLFPESNL